MRNGLQPAGEAARAAEAAGEATEAAQLVPSPAGGAGGTMLPREDFAELVLQYAPRNPYPYPYPLPLPLTPYPLPLTITRYALRCARCKDEGAPALRVVRVAPAGGAPMFPSYHPCPPRRA